MIVVSWLLFLVGLVCSTAFVALYLVDTKPWRGRNGDTPGLRAVRRNLLLWAVTVAALYLGSFVTLLAAGASPSLAWPNTVGRVIGAVLTGHQLYAQLRVRRAGRPKSPTKG